MKKEATFDTTIKRWRENSSYAPVANFVIWNLINKL